jgi:hypothetical protein
LCRRSKITVSAAVATTPRAAIPAYKAAQQLRLSPLKNLRQLARIDLFAVEEPWVLKALLAHYREMATLLDRLLQVGDRRQRKCSRDLVGPPHAIKSVLEAIEDKIENLEIATSPEVNAAIEELIDEAPLSAGGGNTCQTIKST